MRLPGANKAAVSTEPDPAAGQRALEAAERAVDAALAKWTTAQEVWIRAVQATAAAKGNRSGIIMTVLEGAGATRTKAPGWQRASAEVEAAEEAESEALRAKNKAGDALTAARVEHQRLAARVVRQPPSLDRAIGRRCSCPCSCGARS